MIELYNTERPHSALGYRAPAAYARRLNALRQTAYMIGRTLVGENAIRTIELAMELAGGAGFCRAAGQERRFQDVQGARYHPLQAGPQAQHTGTMALGQPVAAIY